MADRFLYRDLIREATETGSNTTIRVSSQTGGQIEPVNRNDVKGSAKYRIRGDFRGLDTEEIAVKVTAVGSPSLHLVGVQPMVTEPKADPGNTGDGTCDVKAGNNCARSFDLHVECIDSEESQNTINAKGTSDDYDHESDYAAPGSQIFGGVYINNRSGEEGSAGNNASIVISKQGGSDPHPWGATSTGLTLARDFDVDEYYIQFSSNPSGALSNGDYIQIGSSSHVYLIFELIQKDNTYWAYVWPRPPAKHSSGETIYKISGGYKVECKNPSGSTLATYYGHKHSGSETPIVSILDIYYALNEGTGTNGYGSTVAACGYEVDLERIQGYYLQPIQAETITLTGGSDAGEYPLFVVTAKDEGLMAELGKVYGNGAWTTLGSGTQHELKFKISQGDTKFVNGDKFTMAAVQAQIRISRDGGLTWESAIDVNDPDSSGDQDQDAYVSLGNGLDLYVQLGQDTTPFVVDDILYFTASYRFGWRNLAVQDRFKKLRFRRIDDPQLILIDLGGGNTADIDLIALMDVVANGLQISMVGFADSDIEKCYGDIDTVPAASGGSTTLTVTPEKTPSTNEHSGGYLHVCTGTAQGKRYPITANTGTTYTVTGDLKTDGVGAGDKYAIYHTGGDYSVGIAPGSNEQYASGLGLTATWTIRGLLILFTDSTSTEGYVEMSLYRVGESLVPSDRNGSAEPHDHYVVQGTITRSNYTTPAGLLKRHPLGVKSLAIPLKYDYVDPDHTMADIKTMIEYCNHLDRAVAVLFWPDISNGNTFYFGWFDEQWSYQTYPGDIHGRIETTLYTLEVE